jgi:hypothetical protein
MLASRLTKLAEAVAEKEPVAIARELLALALETGVPVALLHDHLTDEAAAYAERIADAAEAVKFGPDA